MEDRGVLGWFALKLNLPEIVPRNAGAPVWQSEAVKNCMAEWSCRKMENSVALIHSHGEVMSAILE